MGEIRLADIGAYSTIIWHGNDYFNLDISQIRIDLLKEYLEYEGNLLYTGYVPSKAFEGNSLIFAIKRGLDNFKSSSTNYQTCAKPSLLKTSPDITAVS